MNKQEHEKTRWANMTLDQRKEHRIRIREKHHKLRLEAIQALGGKCVHCGFDDPRALQIDHKNGGGSKERRERKITSYALCSRIAKDPLGAGLFYQLLCANCNWIKRYENFENPRRKD